MSFIEEFPTYILRNPHIGWRYFVSNKKNPYRNPY